MLQRLELSLPFMGVVVGQVVRAMEPLDFPGPTKQQVVQVVLVLQLIISQVLRLLLAVRRVVETPFWGAAALLRQEVLGTQDRDMAQEALAAQLRGVMVLLVVSKFGTTEHKQ